MLRVFGSVTGSTSRSLSPPPFFSPPKIAMRDSYGTVYVKVLPSGAGADTGFSNRGRAKGFVHVQSYGRGVQGVLSRTDPDPIAMVIRVELVIHKPTDETNAN